MASTEKCFITDGREYRSPDFSGDDAQRELMMQKDGWLRTVYAQYALNQLFIAQQSGESVDEQRLAELQAVAGQRDSLQDRTTRMEVVVYQSGLTR